MERDAFLGRVRAAVGASRLPSSPGEDPGLLVPDLPEVDLVEAFANALRTVDGEVHQGVEPVAFITDLAKRHGASRFISWDPDHLPVGGLLDALGAAGLEHVGAVVPRDAEGRLAHQADYMDLVIGITGAEAGFAESGSVVVRSGPGQPRMASLIPLVHVALLEASRIHRSLAHWALTAQGTMADPSNLVFITGPSRTGDIEQQLNLGVHGPREVHVVLI